MKALKTLGRLPSRAGTALCLAALGLFLLLPALHRLEHARGHCRGGALEHVCARAEAPGNAGGLRLVGPVGECRACEIIFSGSTQLPGCPGGFFVSRQWPGPGSPSSLSSPACPAGFDRARAPPFSPV